MKVVTILALLLAYAMLVLDGWNPSFRVTAQEGKKPPDVLVLGAQAKLGAVKFSHTAA